MVNILFIGDIVGKPGRHAVNKLLPRLKEELNIEFVIANGENAAGGKGLTPAIVSELCSYGIDVITGGNHIWANSEILKIIDSEPALLRPANFPPDMRVPGKGAGVFTRGDFSIAVISLVGRVFMKPYECPFRTADKIIEELKEKTPLIIVDFHAEATSEKVAMGWFLDGKVTAVVGTHTHVQTADERILPGGTAYITDCGMTGPFDSVIGVKKDIILNGFLTLLPVKHSVAKNDVRLSGVVITADPISGKASAIQRIFLPC